MSVTRIPMRAIKHQTAGIACGAGTVAKQQSLSIKTVAMPNSKCDGDRLRDEMRTAAARRNTCLGEAHSRRRCWNLAL
jgi:hypothetical protein